MEEQIRPFFMYFEFLQFLYIDLAKILQVPWGVVVFLDVHHQFPKVFMALYLRSLPWGAS